VKAGNWGSSVADDKTESRHWLILTAEIAKDSRRGREENLRRFRHTSPPNALKRVDRHRRRLLP